MNSQAVKFISISPDVGFAKTERTRHACDSCRKRKRRCLHDYQNVRNGPSAASPLLAASSKRKDREDRNSRIQTPRKRLRSHGNAEISLLPSSPNSARGSISHQGTEPATSSGGISLVAQSSLNLHPGRPKSSTDRVEEGGEPRFIGHLNPEGFFLATTRPGASEASKHGDNLGFWLPQESWSTKDAGQRFDDTEGDSLAQDSTSQIAEAPCPRSKNAESIPALSSFQALREIYFRDIHPVFPILHPEVVPKTVPEFVHTKISPTERILIQALCIAVATNNAARPYLRLKDSKEAMIPRDFVKSLSQSILATLEMFKINDRLLLIRVFTILSLFSAFSSDDHTAAEYCARAVSNLHTMQLQLDTLRIRKDHTVVTQIFLCVWALDRLSAAFHSRPSLMHARDIGRDMNASIARQQGCFRALLMVCGLLDQVIDLYRPSHQAGYEAVSFDIPSFDELVEQAEAVHCPTNLLATIETLYHAIAMLSHRFHSLDDPDRSSMSYLRSSLSAARLIHLVRTDLTRPLSNFPFVPYSVALALRVSYRELRLSKTPLYRLEARGQVLHLCTVLEEFGSDYIFARGLARLATKIIREIDKVATSALQAHQRDTDRSVTSGGRSTSMAKESGAVAHQTDSIPTMSQCCHSTTETAERSDYPNPPHMNDYDFGNYHAESFEDAHKFPNLPDIFEHFDPDFNLEAVDFALIQNLGLDSFDGGDPTTQAS